MINLIKAISCVFEHVRVNDRWDANVHTNEWYRYGTVAIINHGLTMINDSHRIYETISHKSTVRASYRRSRLLP